MESPLLQAACVVDVVPCRDAGHKTTESSLLIGGMTCSSCAATVESALRQVRGVRSAVVHVATEKATVVVDVDASVGIRDLVAAVEDVGFDASVLTDAANNREALEQQRQRETRRYKRDSLLSAVCIVPILVAMLVLEHIPVTHHALMETPVRGLSWMSVSVAAFAADRCGLKAGETSMDFNVDSFVEVAGRGVSGVVQGCEVALGNAQWVLQSHQSTLPTELQATVEMIEAEEDRTVVFITVDKHVVVCLALADAPRPDALATIQHLQSSSGRGLDVWMMTGDNVRTARAIAMQLGIPQDRVLAQVLPGDKAAAVKALQRDGQRVVAMVGDGINDTPALAQADVGIALGAGTQIAIDTASVVLIKSQL